MPLQVAWPSNKMAFKQDGWARIYCDEYSLIKGANPQMLRKRTDTYTFSYIFGLSSMDPNRKGPASEDPILVEYKKGSQHQWMMPDPETGNLFKWEMGGPDLGYGLTWDQTAKGPDGIWDLDKVRASACFVTPDQTRIANCDRMTVTRTGRWVPTNPNAPASVRSYHLNSFGLPFKSGDFGQIAVAFLEAKHQGPQAIKAFVYEYLAEEWGDEVQKTDEEALQHRIGEYKKGTKFSEAEAYENIYVKKPSTVIVTSDVQKGYHYQVAREWIQGGDSGLIEWGKGVLLEDLVTFEQGHGAGAVFIDGRYRKMEVMEASFYNKWVPTFGSDKLALPYRLRKMDPFEGVYGSGKYSIGTYTFDTDLFKTHLQDMINGEGAHLWMVYHGTELEYMRQVCSEERVNGEWVMKRGHTQNHLWDCEVLQYLAAVTMGIVEHGPWAAVPEGIDEDEDD